MLLKEDPAARTFLELYAVAGYMSSTVVSIKKVEKCCIMLLVY